MAEDSQLERLVAFHERVDRSVAGIAERLGHRLRCGRGCASCCVDGLSVLTVEAARIEARAAEAVRSLVPHAPGACVFLQPDASCGIYDDRPYVCRTQGLPLRWFELDEDDEVNENRDICPKNAEGRPLDELSEDELWSIGPAEDTLLTLQEEFADGALVRVELRELYASLRA